MPEAERTGQGAALGGSLAADGALERRLGRIFTLVVANVAFFAAAWWAVRHGGEQAAIVAMSVLIVACPCAVALAGPIVVARTLAGCARDGVLIRDPDAIERLATLETALLDKTGTLTAGEPRVVATVWAVQGEQQRALAGAVAAVESAARHPVAQAIARELEDVGGHAGPATVQDVQGGVIGASGGLEVAVLGPAAAAARGLRIGEEISAFVTGHAAAGATIACVAHDGAAVAAFALRDRLRPGVRDAVDTLRAHAIAPALLSGDHGGGGGGGGGPRGAPHATADATPADKERAVAERGAASTMMIGDGFNDVAALRRASVAITLASAPAAAIEGSHVVLASAGLPGIASLLGRAAAARRAARVAIAWALFYNAVGIALAAAGTITPLLAAVLMPISSLTVVIVATLMTRESAPKSTTAGPHSRPQ